MKYRVVIHSGRFDRTFPSLIQARKFCSGCAPWVKLGSIWKWTGKKWLVIETVKRRKYA